MMGAKLDTFHIPVFQALSGHDLCSKSVKVWFGKWSGRSADLVLNMLAVEFGVNYFTTPHTAKWDVLGLSHPSFKTFTLSLGPEA